MSGTVINLPVLGDDGNYTTTVEFDLKPTINLLWQVAKCLVTRREIRVLHTQHSKPEQLKISGELYADTADKEQERGG